MASIIDDIRRNMLPLWRSYEDTAQAKELNYTGSVILPVGFNRFEFFRQQWEAKPSVVSAADLINIGVVSGQKNLSVVMNAAEYLLNHPEQSSRLALDVARSIAIMPTQPLVETNSIVPSFSEIVTNLIDGLETQETDLKARIGVLRRQVHEHPYNPISYCELARCYASLGLDEKAKLYMDYAVYLAPHSRYISRCAARFYVHINDYERAKKVLISNGRISNDPWLMSAEIAVESVMERSSRYVKIGRQLVFSGDVSPYSSSELCFAICNEDREAGKRKDARKMFEKGLVDPNDNCLAQAQFFAKEDENINLDIASFKGIVHKYEADTRKALIAGQYQDAFVSSLKWMHEYRFEHRPIEFAFGISCDFLKEYDYAINIVKRYLNTAPKDQIAINNLIYALGLSDRVEEAEYYMQRIDLDQYKKEDNSPNGICLLATCGLIEYRKGHIEDGRELYNKAIEVAKKRKDKKLADRARLNMIREEVHCVEDYDTKLLSEMETLNTGSKLETEQLKKDILLEVEKKNNVSPE